MTGLEVNGYDPCRAHTVNLPFEVDIAAFEVAILNAMDHVGYEDIPSYHDSCDPWEMNFVSLKLAAYALVPL
jgi:hypothetical protein